MANQTPMAAGTAKLKFKLANAWQLRGSFAKAETAYQEALQDDPNYFPACVQLGHLMTQQARLQEAADYYDRALSLNADAVDLSFYYSRLGLKPQSESTQESNPDAHNFSALTSHPLGKINLGQQRIFSFHRHGWGFALQALKPLHNSHGVLFDGYLEDNFLFKQRHSGKRPPRVIEKMKVDGVFEALGTLEEKEIVPYQQPWVGFLHNPPNVPKHFLDENLPQNMFEQSIWKESLKHCVGLFSLSEYHAAWVRERTAVPVNSLIYPTAMPERQFDFQKFSDNSHKKIVQVGWWLRKLSAIYKLPLAEGSAAGYEKIMLVPAFVEDAQEYLQAMVALEREEMEGAIAPEYENNTQAVQHLPNDEYDLLFTENIIFIELYDTSANTAVVECIARATPLLINPLPAVVEYLGTDYPFYFRNLSEAAAKATDMDLVLATHDYLKSHSIRSQLSATHFSHAFQNSEIYQSI